MADDAEREHAPLTLEHAGPLKPLLGLSVRNALLNIVTLSFYRFWGKTEVRRRVWSMAQLNGEPLEYTGRGKELFFGFLIALGVILIPYIGIVALTLAAPTLSRLFSFVFYVGFVYLLGFGQFTAFRYAATRTAWRGVRFAVAGKAGDYAARFLGFALLAGLTLGWHWPAARRKLYGDRWGALRFGDKRFAFNLNRAQKVRIYRPFAMGWCAAITGYLGLIVAFSVVAPGLIRSGLATYHLAFLLFPSVLIVGLAVAAAFMPYQAALLRSVAAGLSFEGVTFELEIKARDLTALIVVNFFIIVGTLGVLIPYTQARTVRFMINHLRPKGGTDLAAAAQSALAIPKRGEGLADLLDLSPI